MQICSSIQRSCHRNEGWNGCQRCAYIEWYLSWYWRTLVGRPYAFLDGKILENISLVCADVKTFCTLQHIGGVLLVLIHNRIMLRNQLTLKFTMSSNCLKCVVSLLNSLNGWVVVVCSIKGSETIWLDRHYLWGTHFYWMCDCKAVQEVVEYTGSIVMVQRWAQELLGYHFTVIHWSEKIMGDVYAITWWFREKCMCTFV